MSITLEDIKRARAELSKPDRGLSKPEIIVSPKVYQRLLDAMAKGFKPPIVFTSVELMFYLTEFERSNYD